MVHVRDVHPPHVLFFLVGSIDPYHPVLILLWHVPAERQGWEQDIAIIKCHATRRGSWEKAYDFAAKKPNSFRAAASCPQIQLMRNDSLQHDLHDMIPAMTKILTLLMIQCVKHDAVQVPLGPLGILDTSNLSKRRMYRNCDVVGTIIF